MTPLSTNAKFFGGSGCRSQSRSTEKHNRRQSLSCHKDNSPRSHSRLQKQESKARTKRRQQVDSVRANSALITEVQSPISQDLNKTMTFADLKLNTSFNGKQTSPKQPHSMFSAGNESSSSGKKRQRFEPLCVPRLQLEKITPLISHHMSHESSE